jgi:hypothetical protein
MLEYKLGGDQSFPIDVVESIVMFQGKLEEVQFFLLFFP